MNRLISENNKKRMRRKAEDRAIAGAYFALLACAFADCIPEVLDTLLYVVSVMLLLYAVYYAVKCFNY